MTFKSCHAGCGRRWVRLLYVAKEGDMVEMSVLLLGDEDGRRRRRRGSKKNRNLEYY